MFRLSHSCGDTLHSLTLKLLHSSTNTLANGLNRYADPAIVMCPFCAIVYFHVAPSRELYQNIGKLTVGSQHWQHIPAPPIRLNPAAANIIKMSLGWVFHKGGNIGMCASIYITKEDCSTVALLPQGGDWKCRTGKWRTGKWRTKVQGWKMQDWKMTDKSARWEYRCYHQQI